MYLYELIAVILYFTLILAVGIFSYRRHLSSADFIIGGRSMNYWLTALAAHASDMSNWLFMGYPAVVLASGLFQAWSAIGLIFFMFLNWQLIAPKIRIATEQYNCLTFSSFFESRLADTSGTIRVFTALISLIFYTIYISAGLVGLGLLFETLFQLNYYWGVIIGTIIVVPYVFSGGYITLAWIDLFQGLFLMTVIIFVPLFLLPKIGGFAGIATAMQTTGVSLHLLPNFSQKTLLEVLSLAAGWGLGYFGQPHIVTKFMGIRNVHEISKSKWIGMTWMVLSLTAATVVGLVGIAYYSKPLANTELVFIEMVRQSFPSFIAGFILCAVLAATINQVGSQILVLSSNIAEDFYKRIFRKAASSKELLTVARVGVILVALIAFSIAFVQFSTIYSLVFYAWSGLGAAFGPLLLLSLYWKPTNKYGAWSGIITGGVLAGSWPYFNQFLSFSIPAILPAFTLSTLMIVIISYATQTREVFTE